MEFVDVEVDEMGEKWLYNTSGWSMLSAAEPISGLLVSIQQLCHGQWDDRSAVRPLQKLNGADLCLAEMQLFVEMILSLKSESL